MPVPPRAEPAPYFYTVMASGSPQPLKPGREPGPVLGATPSIPTAALFKAALFKAPFPSGDCNRPRDAERLVSSHVAAGWQREDLNPGHLALKGTDLTPGTVWALPTHQAPFPDRQPQELFLPPMPLAGWATPPTPAAHTQALDSSPGLSLPGPLHFVLPGGPALCWPGVLSDSGLLLPLSTS